MKYFKYEHNAKTLTIYPLVCMHLGAKEADVTFLKEHIARISDDPQARWVYLGDGGECVTISSKGSIYHQTLSPDEQIDALVDILEPVKDRGLFGVSGNHDRRITKLSGLDWTHALCARLGIPYMGVSCFMKLKVGVGDKCLFYDTFWHHGLDSASVIGSKVNKALKINDLVWADAVFSAHSHICLDNPPQYVAYLHPNNDTIQYREIRSFICGCAYDSRTGYAEERGYSPILPAYLGVTFDSHTNHRKTINEARNITCQIWRKKI